MVPFTQIFAQALGFRMNWDDPPDSFRPYRHLSRRAVYDNLEILLNRNGLDGFQCVRRAICDLEEISEPKSISFKILKMIFR
ncbi:jg27898 [Pararge aegeria aegeria]|uniref:Jg27898 protein n=2 Tax=Pararge aegeria TaxID=116150 RepID=A0A8S4SN59_9NEOP|nr:jg27898 [Pararge aegeria aegeria]